MWAPWVKDFGSEAERERDYAQIVAKQLRLQKPCHLCKYEKSCVKAEDVDVDQMRITGLSRYCEDFSR